MALTVNINCKDMELHLPDNVILSYHYYSDTDGYAKGYPKYVKLNLVIDVFALLSNSNSNSDKISLEENLIVLEKLRIWGNQRFEKGTTSYYRHVSLTQTHEDIIFREIELSHAYVNNFIENLEFSKRVHTITLELLQREDKLDMLEFTNNKGGTFSG